MNGEVDRNMYITAEAKILAKKRLELVSKELVERKLQQGEAYDPGTMRQTDEVRDLATEAQRLLEEKTALSAVISNGIVVNPGEEIDGIIIGAKIILVRKGNDKQEYYRVGTRWDVILDESKDSISGTKENPKVVSFDAPLVRNAFNRVNLDQFESIKVLRG